MLNRRRFLKYAGSAAIVVGASALGFDYFLNPQHTANQAASSLTTLGNSTSMSTASSTKLFPLSGRLSFDYNGNGKQDGEEPAIENAKVLLTDPVDTTQVIAQQLTDSSGDYELDVPAGNYQLFIKPDNTSPKSTVLRYMCQSTAEITEIGEGYPLNVFGPTTFNVGLMEGFLTLPFTTKTSYSIPRYYDWDPDLERSLWWNGAVGDDPNNHIGIDYAMDVGNDLVSAAPGVIDFIGDDQSGKFIVVRTTDNFFVDYGHVSEFLVEKGQIVQRGQVIAKSGNTYKQFPHLHFQLALISNGPGNMLLDPYRPVFQMQPKYNGYWSFTKTTDSRGQYWRWVGLDTNSNPNLMNYWTKDNGPQYSIA